MTPYLITAERRPCRQMILTNSLQYFRSRQRSSLKRVHACDALKSWKLKGGASNLLWDQWKAGGAPHATHEPQRPPSAKQRQEAERGREAGGIGWPVQAITIQNGALELKKEQTWTLHSVLHTRGGFFFPFSFPGLLFRLPFMSSLMPLSVSLSEPKWARVTARWVAVGVAGDTEAGAGLTIQAWLVWESVFLFYFSSPKTASSRLIAANFLGRTLISSRTKKPNISDWSPVGKSWIQHTEEKERKEEKKQPIPSRR